MRPPNTVGCRIVIAIGAALLAAAWVPDAVADTLQELPVAGLSFSRTPGVAISLEDVGITLEATAFRYQLVNSGSTSAVVDVTFSLPTVDLSDPDQAFAFPTDDPVNFLGASLSIDGKPTKLAFRQIALVDGKDVTRHLREANLPVLISSGFQARLATLATAQVAKLIGDGLLQQTGAKEGGTALLFPVWSVRTSATFHQRMDPGQPVVIEARALVSLGASQDTVLRKALRQQEGLQQDVDRTRKKYCVDEAFLGGLDKLAGASDENGAHIQERRIDLLLTPPPQLDGPVGTFHLTLDKGKPDNLISTCLTDLKKTSATSFEVLTSNVEPPHGLHIVVIGKF